MPKKASSSNPPESPKKYNLRSSSSKTKENLQPDPEAKKKLQPKAKKQNSAETTPEDVELKTKNSKNIEETDLNQPLSMQYDHLIPSVEDVLRNREKKKLIKEMDKLVNICKKRFLDGIAARDSREAEEKNKSAEKPSVTTEYKNCKNFTLSQLTKLVTIYWKYIDDIFYGRVITERHERFQRDTPKNMNNSTDQDLRVNYGNAAFTQDQQIHIVQMFRARYDQGNIYKWSDFYYKVLLPELCLKIFSDVHNMTLDDSEDYLKKSIPPRVFS